LVAPGESIQYYDAVLARDKTADQSVRLFMVPGMAHCAGGPGATHLDPLGAVVDWVEHGVAPQKIIATGDSFTRPLCPYPQTAQYKGTGDTNDASNFVCTN
jgi:feruloyl esterase